MAVAVERDRDRGVPPCRSRAPSRSRPRRSSGGRTCASPGAGRCPSPCLLCCRRPATVERMDENPQGLAVSLLLGILTTAAIALYSSARSPHAVANGLKTGDLSKAEQLRRVFVFSVSPVDVLS